MDETQKWEKRLQRERTARKEAERLLEEKSLELYELNIQLQEQVQTQGDELVRRQALVESIFRSAMDGIILLDGMGRIIEVNDAAIRMLGYSRKQLVRRRVSSLLATGGRPAAVRAFRQALQIGYCRHEGDLRRVDGSVFPAEVVGSGTEVGGEKVVIGIFRDITNRIRTLSDLKMARDDAQRANAAKSLFLASMSHEIRTPLNGILGFTEMVLDSALTAEQRGHLQLVTSSGKMLQQIIDDILDFSRIESGRMVIEHRAYAVAEMLREMHVFHEQAAAEKGLSLALAISDRFPERVVGDVTRVRQILSNLVANAIKFTKDGGVEIAADCDGQNLEISVMDSGIGFDDEIAESLFEAFSQADASTTRKYGGTGLGLAICRQLAQAMDGRIEAEGRTGEGARFLFTFPFIEEEGQEDEASVAAQKTKAEKPLLKGREVLVAEDNPINSQLITLMLEKIGIVPRVVETGVEALEELKKNSHYSAVLMDRYMQDMDGIEATQRIRSGEAGEEARRIPIIAVSASALPEDQQLCLDAGMNAFLPKPLKSEDLLSQLKALE